MAETPRPEQLPKLQPDRVKPLEFLSPGFQQLEDAAIHTQSTVAVAMDQYGNPLFDEDTITKEAMREYYEINNEGEEIEIRANRQSELPNGEEPNEVEIQYFEGVRQHGSNAGIFVESRRDYPLPMQGWKVEGDMDPVFEKLPDWRETPETLLDRSSAQVRSLIKTHLESVKEKFSNKNVVLYSPYFENPKDVHSQIDVTKDVQLLMQALENDIAAMERGEKPQYLEILDEPVEAMVVNSYVRAAHIPTPVPFTNEQYDIGPGDSNKNLATTMKMGEGLVVRARMGTMYYVEGSPLFNDGPDGEAWPAVRGWVSATEIAQLQKNSLEGMTEVTYTGAPQIYDTDGKGKTLRYADSLFKDATGNYHVATKGQDGMLQFQALSDIDDSKVIEGITTHQEFVDFIAEGMTHEGYGWGGHDCSGIIREGFKAMGKKVTEYSGTITEQLAALRGQSGSNLEITSVAQLQAMEPGLYYSDIQYPQRDEEGNIIGYSSTHVFLIQVPDLSHIQDEALRKQMMLEQTKVFSNGYAVLSDKGVGETVWGSHECSGAALAIHVGKRDRKLRPVKI